MRWKVDWNKSGFSKPGRSPSTCWILNGYVVAASAAMQWSVGLTSKKVSSWLYWKDVSFKVDSQECVPHTVPYHRQLKANVDALLALLEKK